MTATLVGTPGTFYNGNAVTTGTVARAPETQVGDLMILTAAHKRNPVVVTPPDGTWTLLIDRGIGGATPAGHLNIFYKVATTAGAQSYTVTTDGGATTALTLTTFRGATAPAVLGSSSTSANTTVPKSAITTTGDAQRVLWVLGMTQNSGNDQSTLTWNGGPVSLAHVQGLALTNLATETGPTPAGTVAARSVTLPIAPSGTAAAPVALSIPDAPSGAPTNTAAPAVTGTPAVGQTLTVSNGTWDQTITSYARQWQRDGVDISGATGSTYTVTSADAGHTLRAVVTATSANGSTSANSNGVAVPAAPANVTAPALATDGSPATGETITCGQGVWSGSGNTYAYQWYRGATILTGETSDAYTLTVPDEGANISCRVTATNGGGTATANSNTITPAVTAALSDASFVINLSGGTGNTDPHASLGGARGATYNGGTDALFDQILGSVAQAGGVFYRVVYVRNTHTQTTAAGLKAYLEAQHTHPGLELAVAVPAEAANTVVPALASQTTAPTGVTWATTTDPTAGAAFGSLAPTAFRGLYLRLTVAPGTAQTPGSSATFAVQGSPA